MFELNQQQQQLEQFVEQSKRTENTTNRFRIMDITIFSSITRRANTQLREFNTGYCYSDVHRKHIKARFESSSSNAPNNISNNNESTVAKTKSNFFGSLKYLYIILIISGMFEKTKNPINASNRFKPALKPKPKHLSQVKKYNLILWINYF